jgi:hypothetical protein
MMEEWREVPEYPRYQVSNLGRVRSCAKPGHPNRDRAVRRTDTWRILKTSKLSKKGYASVTLHVEGQKEKREYVHRLVLLAFVGPSPEGKPNVRHLDGDHDRNHLDNLAWGSQAENLADMDTHGTRLRGDTHQNMKYTDADIAEMRRLYAEGVPRREVAVRFCADPTYVSKLVNGQRGRAA